MEHRACIAWAALAFMAYGAEAIGCDEVFVGPGQSLQAAIDALRPGGIVRLAEGAYPERIAIDKSVTILGAGWDKTVIGPDNAPPAASARASDVEQPGRAADVPHKHVDIPPTLVVSNTIDVVVRDLKIRGPHSIGPEGAITEETLIRIDGAAVTIADCAVVGQFMHGVTILGGSDVRIERSLVAAMWGTGVQIRRSKERGVPDARVAIVESDLRNCHHRGLTIASSDVIVERSRISGSAWHGIRYDGCSPTIRANHIFGNARSGIYASGETAANVTGNVFWRNEMNGVSCWFSNADTIEGNTFVGNLREALAILGESQPKVTRNLFVENPIAITGGSINSKGSSSVYKGELATIAANVFWQNELDYQITGQPAVLPPSNDVLEPGFVDAAAHDFALVPGSLARRAQAGALDPPPLVSRFPIQPEENAMIPDTPTRDSNAWKR